MKETLLSLPLKELREMAKNINVKGISGLRKEELVDILCEEYRRQREAQKSAGEEKPEKPREPQREAQREVQRELPREPQCEAQRELPREPQREPQRELPREPRRENAREAQRESGKDSAARTMRGFLEITPNGYGFVRTNNFFPSDQDVYVAPPYMKRLNLKTGDYISGTVRPKRETENYDSVSYIEKVNDEPVEAAIHRPDFDKLTPIFPNERIHLERKGGSVAMRVVDLISPIGKGQRGMIVAQPKVGKTTLLKEIAKSVIVNHPEMHLIILLIDERPEEVTDMKETVKGENVEIIYSTFDEQPEHHKKVSEMVIERAKRLVEHRQDVIILLDSITRLARAYNLTVPPSGRTLSGGLDPAALYMPKKFFGAARNMREGGSLTILATALVDTGSKMDDVVYEEFKGTGNMELVLDRKLSERRVFPAIDIIKSGTRREDLLYTPEERTAAFAMRRNLNSARGEESVELILNHFYRTESNEEFIRTITKNMRFSEKSPNRSEK